MDESGGNRVHIRVQEWARKLHPDALRNRLRNFRRYMISATTEKHYSTSNTRGEACVSTMASELRDNSDISINSIVLNEVLDGRCVNTDDEKFSSHEEGALKLNADANADLDNVRIPDVIVQTNNSPLQSCDRHPNFNNSTNKNLQLAVGIDSTPRNKSPITVQEWIDSLPLTPTDSSREECELPDKNVALLGDCDSDNLTLGAEAGCLVEKKTTETAPPPPPVNVTITGCAEPSEVESHCSSVDSLLEARKPDPEEVLLSLGFGGTASSSYLETGRIPKRFLQQSQLKGVDIEDFIRQQQDLIYTFESGYYGYRGLAGPSHSNPSVIVAKILEKLREHERETASMTSYQLDFRKRCSLEKNPENPVTNKFSKVARNVLTKIRCTPSSVLSPDNRRWLDSQGSKSPEIPRRLIIGQKSFTLGRDGDLIEASNINNNDQVNNSKINSNEADLQENNTQQREHYDEMADSIAEHVLASYGNLGRRFTDSSTDMSIESIIMKNGYSSASSGNGNDKTYFSDSLDEHRSTRDNPAIRNLTLKRLHHIDVDEPSSLDLYALPYKAEEENCRCETYSKQLCGCINRATDFTSQCETGDNVQKIACSVDQCLASSSKQMSLKDELRHSGIPLADLCTNHCSFKKLHNVLTRYSSFEESLKGSSDDEMTNVPQSGSVDDCRYADSATESEFASYPHRSITNKAIHRQYEELILLESVLHSIGRPVDVRVITKDEFSAVSSEQRCIIQTQIIREALKAYLNQMTEEEIHSELKNCLKAEVQKVADLLENRCDASKLAVVVKQMTLLLQHQSQLSAQIKELSVVDKKPISCHHEMCDQILKRVHDLELLVQQNAQELAQMKNQLLKKDDF